MAKGKKVGKSSISIDLGARAEAKLEVKGKVPAHSLGRLVDALTDIIRPFTESRGLRADLLRLQREEVAVKIAELARSRIDKENGVPNVVPPKILVPLLEKGSCEDINDDEMIRRWSNLLASASMTSKVQPRFVGILGELSGRQALCLEQIAFNNFENTKHPYTDFADADSNYGSYWIREELRQLVEDSFSRHRNKCKLAMNGLLSRLWRPGCAIELIVTRYDDDVAVWDSVHEGHGLEYSDVHVLESLNLIERVMIDIGVGGARLRARRDASVIYWHLTPIGIDLCEVCARDKIERLIRSKQA